jgi:hypothetical protein
MHTTLEREQLAVRQPLAAWDLILARIDRKQVPVRDYIRLFTERRKRPSSPDHVAEHPAQLRVTNVGGGVPADVVAARHTLGAHMTQAATDASPTTV